MWRCGFLRNQNSEREFSGLDQFDFHRWCTGNAEKWFLVRSSWFSVLGCQSDLYRLENQLPSFAPLDSRGGCPHVILVGRVLSPAHCLFSFFLIVLLVRVRDGYGMSS